MHHEGKKEEATMLPHGNAAFHVKASSALVILHNIAGKNKYAAGESPFLGARSKVVSLRCVSITTLRVETSMSCILPRNFAYIYRKKIAFKRQSDQNSKRTQQKTTKPNLNPT